MFLEAFWDMVGEILSYHEILSEHVTVWAIRADVLDGPIQTRKNQVLEFYLAN